MGKIFMLSLVGAVLAGCSASRPEAPIKAPAYSLPGVPLGKSRPAPRAAAPAVIEEAEEEGQSQPATPPPSAAVKTAPAGPAVPALKTQPVTDPAGSLEFHLASAAKYQAKKQYRSAAAEYAAAAGVLPEGDARGVELLERQGAMLSKAGQWPKAQERFQAAISKAGELKFSGEKLSDVYQGLGYCQEKAGNAKEAIASYQAAIENSGSKAVKDRLAGAISGLKAAAK